MSEAGKAENQPAPQVAEPLDCGLIMPISGIDGCTAEHWIEVKNIIVEAVEAIKSPRFNVKLVSDAPDVGVIQKRIVQNIYNSDIVICDVSARNPNVMLELGMRLAFDKATILVKDDQTDYSFDTSVIEHIIYPRALRFAKIVQFKEALIEKLLATHKAFKEDPNASTFLKHFGTFRVAQLNQSVVSPEKYVMETLLDIQKELAALKRTSEKSVQTRQSSREIDLENGYPAIMTALLDYQIEHPGTDIAKLVDDREFQRAIIRKSNASQYFPQRSQFDKALPIVVKAMSAIFPKDSSAGSLFSPESGSFQKEETDTQ